MAMHTLSVIICRHMKKLSWPPLRLGLCQDWQLHSLLCWDATHEYSCLVHLAMMQMQTRAILCMEDAKFVEFNCSLHGSLPSHADKSTKSLRWICVIPR